MIFSHFFRTSSRDFTNLLQKPRQMSVLTFSIFLISTILLVIYFWNADKRKELKVLMIFGLFIGIVSVILCKFNSQCFGASTPLDIKTQNLTEQNLKIYTIAFWEDYGSGSGIYVLIMEYCTRMIFLNFV